MQSLALIAGLGKRIRDYTRIVLKMFPFKIWGEFCILKLPHPVYWKHHLNESSILMMIRVFYDGKAKNRSTNSASSPGISWQDLADHKFWVLSQQICVCSCFILYTLHLKFFHNVWCKIFWFTTWIFIESLFSRIWNKFLILKAALA